MIRIGVLGDIGSGKSYIAKQFGFPVFDADQEVSKLYSRNKKVFFKLKESLPNYFNTFPIRKEEIINAIIDKDINLKKIVKIVHKEVRTKLGFFLKKNKTKKIVILDIPLLLENKIYKKRDILIYVQSSKLETLKRLKKRSNFNKILLKKFKKIQLPLDYKKNKSQFIIKNNFMKNSVKKDIKRIIEKIVNERNHFRY
tara:strand:- start:3584 stop:4177 length:594 start_codon:yes stop_codon:yes gene_type:complete